MIFGYVFLFLFLAAFIPVFIKMHREYAEANGYKHTKRLLLIFGYVLCLAFLNRVAEVMGWLPTEVTFLVRSFSFAAVGSALYLIYFHDHGRH